MLFYTPGSENTLDSNPDKQGLIPWRRANFWYAAWASVVIAFPWRGKELRPIREKQHQVVYLAIA